LAVDDNLNADKCTNRLKKVLIKAKTFQSRKEVIANESAERRRSAGEAAENSAA